MYTYKKIPFQKIRLLWFSLSYAKMVNKARTEREKQAYEFIARMGAMAINAVDKNQGQQFMNDIEQMTQFVDGQAMLERELQRVREQFK